MMKLSKTLMSTVFLVLVVGQLSAQKLHTIRVTNLNELQKYFTYSPKRPVVISGHRGGMMPGYPENSIAALKKTLSLMPSFFEIDPQLTKDSVLVLMHDKTVDRTTNSTGLVSELTYAELQKLFLEDRQGNVTPYRIPTLLEALEWGQNKTIFNLDNKGVPWSLYSRLLNEWKFPNIILSVRSLEEAMFYFERNDNVMFCVEISNIQHYHDYANSGIPWNRIMAYVRFTMDPQQQKLYDLLHSHGVMCMIAIAPTQDKLKTDEEKRAGYLKEIARKPDIIETDYPYLFLGLPLDK